MKYKVTLQSTTAETESRLAAGISPKRAAIKQWSFSNRREAERFARKHGAELKIA